MKTLAPFTRVFVTIRPVRGRSAASGSDDFRVNASRDVARAQSRCQPVSSTNLIPRHAESKVSIDSTRTLDTIADRRKARAWSTKTPR